MTKKIFMKMATAAVLFLIILAGLTKVFNPKWNYYGNQAQTRLQAFYRQEKNSDDVLYTGSSFAYCGISPLSIYEKYGITGYVFSNPSQKTYMSYYYLREALKYQSPKVVVYEVGTVDDDDFANEGYHRKNLDYMRWSPVKWEAVRFILDNCPDENLKDYLFPFLRYHTRWDDLQKGDFNVFYDKDYYLMGTALKLTTQPAKSKAIRKYQAWTPRGKESSMGELCKEYVLKMKQLCDEKGIAFLMLRVPSMEWSPELSSSVQDFADANGIDYLDMNLHQEELNIDWTTDSHDKGTHVNLRGCLKISDYLGSYLTSRYSFDTSLSVQTREFWDASAARYHLLADSFLLPIQQELSSYLQMLSNENYIAAIAVNGNTGAYLTEAQLQSFAELGLTIPAPGSETAYYAILDGGAVVTQASASGRIVSGPYTSHGAVFTVSSADASADAAASIVINEGEYAIDQPGFNIVVFDKTLQRVVDSVCFATNMEGIPSVHTEYTLLEDDGGE
ncbi:MAG: hypothetical protein Q4B57_03995 [Eubacteriales bacterium]|nr:hypothetical protein [Eubacteriales bacterium]